MNFKVHLRRVKGSFYVSFGSKGYTTTTEFNEYLSELFKEGRGVVTFTDNQTDDSIFKVCVHDKRDFFIMDFYSVETNDLVKSIKQRPRAFREHDISPEFYINYNPEW